MLTVADSQQLAGGVPPNLFTVTCEYTLIIMNMTFSNLSIHQIRELRLAPPLLQMIASASINLKSLI
jgi:hypothetical protein